MTPEPTPEHIEAANSFFIEASGKFEDPRIMLAKFLATRDAEKDRVIAELLSRAKKSEADLGKYMMENNRREQIGNWAAANSAYTMEGYELSRRTIDKKIRAQAKGMKG